MGIGSMMADQVCREFLRQLLDRLGRSASERDSEPLEVGPSTHAVEINFDDLHVSVDDDFRTKISPAVESMASALPANARFKVQRLPEGVPGCVQHTLGNVAARAVPIYHATDDRILYRVDVSAY